MARRARATVSTHTRTVRGGRALTATGASPVIARLTKSS